LSVKTRNIRGIHQQPGNRTIVLAQGEHLAVFQHTGGHLCEWSQDDFDVLADGNVVGRIFKVHAAPAGTRSAQT